MVRFSVWNIRGLNNPLKQKEVASFFSCHKLSLCGLVETKVRSTNLGGVVKIYFPHHVARIILAWDPTLLDVSLLFNSEQMIVVRVEAMEFHKTFFLSIVYGHSHPLNRRSLWEDIRYTGSR